MSDLGNGGWPNSMKLGDGIGLDKLVLDPILFVFALSFFHFSGGGGGPILGSHSPKSTHTRVNIRVVLQ